MKKGAFLIVWLSKAEAKEPNFFLIEVRGQCDCGLWWVSKLLLLLSLPLSSLAQPPLKRPEIILWVCAQLAMTAVR